MEGWWSLYFDGSAGKEGAGAGIWITSPTDESKFYSYKLNFDCTNNMAEYESLILGLDLLKKMKARNIFVFGDSELVIRQVEGVYQTKDVRMRAYKNLVLDMLENFQAYSFIVKTRDQNSIVDSLVVSASLFIIPIHSTEKYEIEVRHRPAIPDNITNWKVFEDDQQVKDFIKLKEEFENTQVDQQNMLVESKGNSKFFQLKNNSIPKGLIPLEKLFDQNDVFKSPKIQADE